MKKKNINENSIDERQMNKYLSITYNTRKEDMEIEYPDHLYEYYLITKISKQLENENCVYNFIF